MQSQPQMEGPAPFPSNLGSSNSSRPDGLATGDRVPKRVIVSTKILQTYGR